MVAVETRTYPDLQEFPIRDLRFPITEIEQRQERDSEWVINRGEYDPQKEEEREVINSLANGYIGVRASVSRQKEGVHCPATYIAGLFEGEPLLPGEKKTVEKVPDLVNIPGFLQVDFHNGREWFDVDQAELITYESNLDLEKGVLTYKARWRDRGGRITRIDRSTFISQADQHVAGIKFSVTPENYSDTIFIKTGIDGNVDNDGVKYLSEEEKGEARDGSIYYSARTKNKKELISLASNVSVTSGDQAISGVYHVASENEGIFHQVWLNAEENRTYSLDKTVSVYSTKDVENPPESAIDKIKNLKPVDELMAEHIEKWKEIWRQIDVRIEGNSEDQLALRYNLFKLRQLAPWNEGASIAAKGEDNPPGKGYKGHVFWDTEIFMLPFFINTDPEVAKRLLMYRYKTLPAARQKAKDHGYKGALYAWESTDTGEEATPEEVKDQKGNTIPIYTGEREYHVSADISYAVWQYCLATHDWEFMRNYGAEIIAETARFWASKAEYNAGKDRYEIKGVIGPDEYHEKGPDGRVGVDNNVFNNKMAQWNVMAAIEIWNAWKMDPHIQAKMGLSDTEAVSWKDIADKMYIPFDPETKIYNQFDGYETLKEIDIPPGVTTMDSYLKERGIDPTKCKPIKQADVLLGAKLLGEDPEVLKANFDYYFWLCSHGSSLSDGTHAEMAARVGYIDLAYNLFGKALDINLGDGKGNGRDGSHTAAAGGAWQAAVYGFGGLQAHNDKLSIDPNLPNSWQAMEFNARYRGHEIEVRADHKNVYLAVKDSDQEPIIAEVKGQAILLEAGKKYKIPLITQKEYAEQDAAGL